MEGVTEPDRARDSRTAPDPERPVAAPEVHSGAPPLGDLMLRDYAPRSCLRSPEHLVDRARWPAVDAHNHLGRWLAPDGGWTAPDVGALIGVMDACNVSAMVNLDGRWGPELEDNLERYDRRHPGRFATFCHLDWSEVAAPGFPDRLVAGLERSAAQGACGLKVWKDLGLHVRDDRGRLLLPNDDRLAPVWDAAAELTLPVLIHTADPVAFFEPVDRFNERLEELLANPEWSFAGDGFPAFETLIEALEDAVASHPATTFIGAHAGCYAENIEWLERTLDAYPNWHIDIAARVAELGRRPRAARDLVERHPDRVLFGTDLFPPAAADLAVHFRFLETADEHFPYSPEPVPPQGRWAISGLGLSDSTLHAVYAGNARRLIPGIDVRA